MQDKEKNSETKVYLDSKTVERMKHAGVEMPENVNHSSWSQVQEISKPVYSTIAYLAAQGMKNSEISQAVGLSESRISVILRSEKMEFKVKELRYKLFGQDAQEKFKQALPTAIDAIAHIAADKATKPQTKFQAASYIVDRVLGRPKQTVEVEGNLIRQLFERLDAEKKTIDVGAKSNTLDDVESIPEAQVSEKKGDTEDSGLDQIDNWASKNL